MKTLLRSLIIFIFLLSIAYSQNKVGTTAAPFLGISIGPRAQAMGSAFVAMHNDITASYWNPAALSMIENNGVMLSHTEWLLGTSFNWVGFNYNIGSGYAFGINLAQLDYGREPITTIYEQEETGRFWDAQDLSIGLSAAKSLTNRFSIGGTAKYIYQQIWNEKASTMAVDIGILFKTNFNNMRLGMSISNYGGEMRLDGDDLLEKIDIDQENSGNNETLVANMKTESYPLPIFFRIGLAYDLFQSFEFNRLTLALDAIHPTDNVEYINMGMEYAWNELVMIRAGYKNLFMPDAQEGFSFGGGLQYGVSGIGKIKIDYAYMDFKDFPGIQTFAFSFLF